jgi:hypothetical protein
LFGRMKVPSVLLDLLTSGKVERNSLTGSFLNGTCHESRQLILIHEDGLSVPCRACTLEKTLFYRHRLLFHLPTEQI